MSIFELSGEQMKTSKSEFTINEIFQQPVTWKKTFDQILHSKEEIRNFLSNVFSDSDYDVIFTGAGSSEFIGNSLYQILNKRFDHKVKSCASTDIVVSPEDFISKNKKTLLVSFGRSGDSPESVGAVELAQTVCKNIYHIFITCNKDGALSKYADGKTNCLAVNLSPETHDKSFAMTSSFTNMLFAAYLVFSLDRIEEIGSDLNEVVLSADNYLNSDYVIARDLVSDFDFSRIVYLGDESLKGIAQESALKMLELTAGKVVTMYDSPLGFRHGPKSIIDEHTLTVLYLSDDEYRRKYELDLLREISLQRQGNKIALVFNNADEDVRLLADYCIDMNTAKNKDTLMLGLEYILFAQSLAVFKSLSMKLTPDNPCPTGEVNRVVKGVTLYKYE